MASITDTNNPLGKSTAYVDQYDPSILFAISRDESWKLENKDRYAVPFYGVDIWNGYEISWLNLKGKPQVCIAEFRIPATSPYLIESKSFKLYLNSFNQTRLESAEEAQARMQADLSKTAGADVEVIFHSLDSSFSRLPEAQCIDHHDIEIHDYQPNANLLKNTSGKFDGWLVSHLLKSNCPVTGQPDWGSVYIYYEGQEIDETALLAYIVSMRQHQGFHEQCCEQIYQDIWQHCQPQKLIVYARYLRRGGLDINPYRSSKEGATPNNFMMLRQ